MVLASVVGIIYINVSVKVGLTTIVACDDVVRRLAEGVEALWIGRGSENLTCFCRIFPDFVFET